MPLSSAIESGLRSLLRHAGVTVTYRRGSDSVEVRLLPARLDQPAEGERALAVGWDKADWIGLREDLVINGERTLPAIDDRIELETDDGIEVWTVSPEQDQHWSPLSGCREAFRVHTVRLP